METIGSGIGRKSVEGKIIWADKSANYIPWIVLGGYTFLGILIVSERLDVISIIFFTVLILGLLAYYRFFSPQTKPIQITSKGLIMTQDKKFPRKRVLVRFKDIKSVRIGGDKLGSRMEFIYLTDKNGKKYWNVIFEVSKFREVFEKYCKIDFDDSGPYRFFPKKLR